jgi:hypothetical protein
MASLFLNQTDFQVMFSPLKIMNISKLLRYLEFSFLSSYCFIFKFSKNQKINFYLLILREPLFVEFKINQTYSTLLLIKIKKFFFGSHKEFQNCMSCSIFSFSDICSKILKSFIFRFYLSLGRFELVLFYYFL